MLFLHKLLLEIGFSDGPAIQHAALALAVFLIFLLAFITNVIAKKVGMRLMRAVVERTSTTWDDALLNRRFLYRLTHLVPILAVHILSVHLLSEAGSLVSFLQNAAGICMLIVGAFIADAFLNAFLDVYARYEISKEMHLKGIVQVLKISVYIVVAILLLAMLVGKTPLYILSGLGALTAVLMLIFKDSILGFVAGIQLTANRMVAIGDWVEMPKYGADGDVIDVALTTVKVQNWDKTITTIPTYALISDAFKNWRGMSESGGRRIKRAIYIDMSTITFCSDAMLERFSQIQYIAQYLEEKREEVAEYNRAHGVNEECRVNGRRLTNVGTFRAYVVSYLHNHPQVNLDMTFLVRQLAPGPHGLPIEIYVFCKDKVWANYEEIQADIFDHILSVVPEFDLRVFQNPAGSDFHALVPSPPPSS
ncbi:MAG: mechanosensitive ion channel [Lentisphaeria bacterium]|nr:mechanosensitive ion channel [Lentisphaeria bacterium]